VGEYIAGVVVKEIWVAQLARTGGRPIDWQAVKNHVARTSPTLSNDILDAIRGWIPIADELNPTTLLPDLHEFPASLSDEDGITLVQRSLLLEALKILFDVFNEENAGSLGVEGMLLPRSGVANVSVQIAAMLDHLSLTRPRCALSQLHQNDLDLSAWQNVCAHTHRKPQPGSKAELIEELQQCRRQIFDLEKELVTQVKRADASADREKKEAEKVVQRLTIVNQALEEKLRSRTEESRNASDRICDLERRIEHERNLVTDKGKKIDMLQRELSRSTRTQSDLLQRERKYGERILQLRMQEFMSICRDSQRKRLVESALRGEVVSEDMIEQPGEKDLELLAAETLRKVQNEFDEYFEDRERNMIMSVEKAEARISKERKNSIVMLEQEWEVKLRAMDPMNVVSPTVRSARRRLSGVLTGSELSRVSVEVQTDASGTSPPAFDAEMAQKLRGSVCMADMSRGKKTSVLMQGAEEHLRRSERASTYLGQPLRRPSAAMIEPVLSPDEQAERLAAEVSRRSTPTKEMAKTWPQDDRERKSSVMYSDSTDGDMLEGNEEEYGPHSHEQVGSPLSDEGAIRVDGISQQESPRQEVKFLEEELVRFEPSRHTLPEVPPNPQVDDSGRARGKSLPNSTFAKRTGQLEALRVGTPSTRASSRVDSRNGRDSRNEPRNSPFPGRASPPQINAPDPRQQSWPGGRRKTIGRMVLQFERTA
jgi:hypothetical protein